MNKFNSVGTVKGFMVNGRTLRMRVYGSKRDIGVDLTPQTEKAIQAAIAQLQAVLTAAYGDSEFTVAQLANAYGQAAPLLVAKS
jgi:formylmethanofuran dehydrogenase subunit E-like metal-binding protein